jgi:BNR/Asp-box repeat.
VSWVQASNYDAGTAYAAFDRHTFGDMAPYVFRTTDFGKTWTPLVTAQDAKGVRGYAWVIKEDVVKPTLLFPGTEFGLYVSIDGGKDWAQFKGAGFRR